MKRFWLACASVVMMVVGLIRGMDGINILVQGDKVDLGAAIQASPGQLIFVGWCLIIVMLLLLSSAIGLTLRRSVRMYIYAWISIGLFLISGFINDFMLYGYPFSGPQIIDWGITLGIALFMILGKNAIKPKYIQSYEN